MNKCPIVPNGAFEVNIGSETIVLAPSMDAVQMFAGRPENNYLRFWDANTRDMRCLYASGHILANIVDLGIPIQKRDSITEQEYTGWVDVTTRHEALGLDEEIDEFFGNN